MISPVDLRFRLTIIISIDYSPSSLRRVDREVYLAIIGSSYLFIIFFFFFRGCFCCHLSKYIITIHLLSSLKIIIKKCLCFGGRRSREKEQACFQNGGATEGAPLIAMRSSKCAVKLSVERSNIKMIEGPKWSFFELGTPSGEESSASYN